MTFTSIHSRASSRAGAPERTDESLLVEARSRARTRLSGRERWTSLALGGGFLLAAGSTWQPTLPVALLANLTAPPLVTDGTTSVAFRFTPQGSWSDWRIDDVYVDPFKGE